MKTMTSHNAYDFCLCGATKQKRSPACRRCTMKKRQSELKWGFKKGYIPWNKGLSNVMNWTPETKEKHRLYIQKNGGPNKGKKRTPEMNKKISEALKGKNAPNWQGGITALNTLRRHSFEHKEWREKIYKRDDYTCQVCKKRGGRIEPHHIKPWRKYKEERYDVSNGITLCLHCHRLTTRVEEKLIDFFKKIINDISKNCVNSGNLLEEMKTILRQS